MAAGCPATISAGSMDYMWNPIYPGVLSLTLFTLGVAAFIYLLNCAIAKRWKRVSLLPALVYFSTVALIGLFGEIFLDTVYNFFVGQPLWWYNIMPIHNGYTSSFAIVTWGLYGLHLYLLHDTLAQNGLLPARATWR